MRKLLALFLLLTLLVPAAWAEDDDEDFYLDDSIFEEVLLDDEGETPSAEPAAQPVYEDDGSRLLTITCTGDFTIGRDTRKRADIFGDELKKHDGDVNFVMAGMRDILAGDDMTLVNFEGTLTNSTYVPTNKKENQFLFSAPPEWVSVLSENSVECVSLENNHVMDHGEEAYEDTKNALREVGIVYSNSTEMGIYNVKGIDICMLSYLCIDRYDKPVGGYSSLYDKVAADIAGAKSQYPLVIVSFHWGLEPTKADPARGYNPTNNQIKLGRLAVDSGADLVVGHHSHRINPIECYNGVYICYSLGNFCFAGNSKPSDMTSFVFQTRFRERDGEIVNEGFRIIPIRISSRKDRNDFIPTPLTDVTATDSVVTVLKGNGKNLKYAVEDYPLTWGDE